jgi:hypothetical protein
MDALDPYLQPNERILYAGHYERGLLRWLATRVLFWAACSLPVALLSFVFPYDGNSRFLLQPIGFFLLGVVVLSWHAFHGRATKVAITDRRVFVEQGWRKPVVDSMALSDVRDLTPRSHNPINCGMEVHGWSGTRLTIKYVLRPLELETALAKATRTKSLKERDPKLPRALALSMFALFYSFFGLLFVGFYFVGSVLSWSSIGTGESGALSESIASTILDIFVFMSLCGVYMAFVVVFSSLLYYLTVRILLSADQAAEFLVLYNPDDSRLFPTRRAQRCLKFSERCLGILYGRPIRARGGGDERSGHQSR